MPEIPRHQAYGTCFTCGKRFIADRDRAVDAEKVRKQVHSHGRYFGHRVFFRKVTERVYDFERLRPYQ